MSRLDDDGLQTVLADAARLRAHADAVVAAGAGVIAKRSDRHLGYTGLSAKNGHRSPQAFLQALTGSSRTEASRQVRLGEAMGEADAATTLIAGLRETGLDGTVLTTGDSDVVGSTDGANGGTPAGETPGPVVAVPWYEPITRAVTNLVLTPEGASAVMRGLGEPNERCDADMLRAAAEELLDDLTDTDTLDASAPGANTPGTNTPGTDTTGTDTTGTAGADGDVDDAARAGGVGSVRVNVDELARRARWVRDRIDPVGITIRAEERYANRKCRFGHTPTGARTAWIDFDDESAAWIDTIVGAAMRPRRGGPRFVDKAEAEKAQKLVADPRTNDQLVFDLLMDVLRAGAVADAATVFGSRQPGIRVVITKEQLETRDENSNLAGTGFLEDTGEAVPPGMVERMLCEVGTRDITVDEHGSPLDVGREQRLFTAKQRVALAIRDGGCMVDGCDRPPSYTEAHHIDEWKADHGKTNIAEGILLGRFDHQRIHAQHWKIKRVGTMYWMIPPPGADAEQKPVRMRSKSPLRYPKTG